VRQFPTYDILGEGKRGKERAPEHLHRGLSEERGEGDIRGEAGDDIRCGGGKKREGGGEEERDRWSTIRGGR